MGVARFDVVRTCFAEDQVARTAQKMVVCGRACDACVGGMSESLDPIVEAQKSRSFCRCVLAWTMDAGERRGRGASTGPTGRWGDEATG